MQVQFSRQFKKQYRKSPKKIQSAFDKRLGLFIKNKNHPTLKNHALTGKFRSFRSINVTGNWRAIFREFKRGKHVFFDALGTHSQLYK